MNEITIGSWRYKKALTLEFPSIMTQITLKNIKASKVTHDDFIPNVASLIGDNIYLRVPAFTASYAIWSSEPIPYLISFKQQMDDHNKNHVIVTGIYLKPKEIEAFRQGMNNGLGTFEWASDFGQAAKWAGQIGKGAPKITHN